MGITMNKMGKGMMQIYGKVGSINLMGIAYKVSVKGNSKKVWHYELSMLKGPRLLKVKSADNEGTLTTEDRLLNKIERVCLDFDSPITENEP